MVEITEVQIDYVKKVPGKEVAEGWARVKVASAGDRIYSYHLGLKTLLNLVITPEYPGTAGVFVTKYLMNKGRPNNYASVWVWTATDTKESSIGSVWLNVHFLGQ